MLDKLIYNLRRLFLTPFKIGLISYYYLDKLKQTNGVAIHTYYLSRELAKLGCEVHVFTKGDKNVIKNYYIGKGKIVIHKINTKIDCPIKDKLVKLRLSYFMFDNAVVTEVTKENTKEKFNVIHTHGWLTTGAFISKSLNNIKWIHTFHALEKNRLKFMSNEEKEYFKVAKWVESTISHADALIAVSDYVRAEVIKDYGIKSEKVFRIYNGVDLEMFKPERSIDEKIILYVGRFSFEKGMDIIPSIAKIVLNKNKEAKFTILAPGRVLPSMQRTEKEYKSLKEKYGDRITLIRDSISREELVKIYNKCSIYIQPSRYDSCPTTLLEAMACSKAVIGSNRGGIPEMISNSGIVVPLGSRIFALQILRLLKDFRLRERYARRAFDRSKLFNWENIGQETLNLYKKISLKNK